MSRRNRKLLLIPEPSIVLSRRRMLVHRLLDRTFPQDPESLRVRHNPHPQPSPDAFHNRWAEPLTIENSEYHIASAYSDRGRCYLDIGAYVRAGRAGRAFTYGDLNTAELERSRDEFQGLLIPAGKREEVSQTDARLYSVFRKYGQLASEIRVEYFRPFVVAGPVVTNSPIQAQISPRTQQFRKDHSAVVLGYGVKNLGNGQRLLLVDWTAVSRERGSTLLDTNRAPLVAFRSRIYRLLWITLPILVCRSCPR